MRGGDEKTEQMWDKDILKWNDCIAEGMLDLGKYFRRAYKKKTEVLKLFESVQTEKAKEAIVKTQQALVADQVTRSSQLSKRTVDFENSSNENSCNENGSISVTFFARVWPARRFVYSRAR